jgi:hypothetical protein
MSNKIKPRSIHLNHSTGPSDVGEGLKNGVIAGTTATVESYEEANETINRWNSLNPVGRPELVDWLITFEDGETMEGTYQICRRSERDQDVDIIAQSPPGC